MSRLSRRCRWGAGVAIAVIAALVAPFAALPAVSAAPTSVVPGQSIGPARLGMTAGAAAAALGPSAAQGPSRRVYPRYGLVLDFDSGVVVRISTASPKYRTVAGAGVGSRTGDTGRLIGDVNAVTTTSGQNTTVVYVFQGVGFIFRAGRAIETFVTAAVPFGPPKNSAVVPLSPPGPPIVVPGGPPAPPGSSGVSAPPSGGAAPARPAAGAGTPSAALRDLAASVLSVGGLTVTGLVANTGAIPISSVVVTAQFTRASGDAIDEKTTISGPLPPGATAPFTLHAAMVADIIIRYQVSVNTGTGVLLATSPAESIPVASYAQFAQRQIHLKVDLGAPAQVVGPAQVQAIVSVADTGAIPPQWVQQVTASIPYTANGIAGSATVQLRPGQSQTVLVPAGGTLGSPVVTGVVLGGQ